MTITAVVLILRPTSVTLLFSANAAARREVIHCRQKYMAGKVAINTMLIF